MASELIAKKMAVVATEGLPQGSPAMQGPSPSSNWVVPGLILCGDVPKGAKLPMLLERGVLHFVDLRSNPENYLVTEVAAADSSARYTSFDLGHHVAHGSMALVAGFLKGLLASCFADDEITYIHCHDGHSLTAVAVCGMLSFIYGITGMKASQLAAQLHGSRKDNDGIHQLLSANQKAFVRDLANDSSPIMLDVPQLNLSLRRPSSVQADPSSSLRMQGSGYGLAMEESAPFAVQHEDPLPPPVMSMDQLQKPSGTDYSVSGESPTGPKRGSRFEHTRGDGGGYTSLNIFSYGGGENLSGSRRGRAAVPGKTDEAVRKPATPSRHSGSGRSTPLKSGHSLGAPQFQHNGASSCESPTGTAHSSYSIRHDSGELSFYVERASLGDIWGIELVGHTVKSIVPKSPAFFANVPVGSAILKVDGNPFMSGDSLTNMTRGLQYVTLTIDPIFREHQSVERYSAASHPVPPLEFPQSDNRDTTGMDKKAPSQRSSQFPAMFEARREQREIQGPTAHSNWVIRGLVLCGPTPQATQREFSALVRTEIDIFVCLVEDAEETVQKYLPSYEQRLGKSCRFICYPMFDGAPLVASSVERFLAFIDELAQLVGEGNRLYIHCHRGHGRTGIVVSALLSTIYGISGMKAVNLCDALHSCREVTEDTTSPQTQEQRLSVISLMSKNN